MNEGLEILKKQLEITPERLREYVLRGDWEEKTEIITSKVNLEEHQKTSIENEVMLVLVGLEPKEDLSENITREAKIDSNISDWITEEIIKEVIGPVINDVNTAIQNSSNKNTSKAENVVETTSGVADSFAQAIVNQAKAMRPIPAAPSNLPTGENKKPIQDYSAGTDPYREPLEN